MQWPCFHFRSIGNDWCLLRSPSSLSPSCEAPKFLYLLGLAVRIGDMVVVFCFEREKTPLIWPLHACWRITRAKGSSIRYSFSHCLILMVIIAADCSTPLEDCRPHASRLSLTSPLSLSPDRLSAGPLPFSMYSCAWCARLHLEDGPGRAINRTCTLPWDQSVSGSCRKVGGECEFEIFNFVSAVILEAN